MEEKNKHTTSGIALILLVLIAAGAGYYLFTLQPVDFDINTPIQHTDQTETQLFTEDYEIPFEISEGETLDLRENIASAKWNEDGTAIEYAIYADEQSEDAICLEKTTYEYALDTQTEDVIDTDTSEWFESPKGTYAIRVLGTGAELTDDEAANEAIRAEAGSVELKTMATDEIRKIGTYYEEQENGLIETYRPLSWSPDEQWIIMSNWNDYENGETMLVALPVDADSLEDVVELGYTEIVETMRCEGMELVWSPDSTMFFASDDLSIFALNPPAKLFVPNEREYKINNPRSFQWSGDGEKILGSAPFTDEDDVTHHVYIMNPDGTDLIDICVSDEATECHSGIWFDDTHIMYSENSTHYVVNIETMERGELGFTEDAVSYRMSPDRSSLLYLTEAGTMDIDTQITPFVTIYDVNIAPLTWK